MENNIADDSLQSIIGNLYTPLTTETDVDADG